VVISEKIRDVLAQAPDGMTALELALALKVTPTGASRALALMPDTYIDRWVKTTGKYAAVHCLAFVPDDCPYPV
jgi:hypothetical protein